MVAQKTPNADQELGILYPSKGALIRKLESPEQQQERVQTLAGHVKSILELLGEDPDREGIVKTPERYAKALLFLTQGYQTDIRSVVNDAIFEEDHDEMMSIAYIPNKTVIGLSKLARIANMFAQRLQVQERLTKQVAQALMDTLKPQGVAVTMKAAYFKLSRHMCMVMRGVQKSGSETITSCMLGVFRDDPKTREEYLKLTA